MKHLFVPDDGRDGELAMDDNGVSLYIMIAFVLFNKFFWIVREGLKYPPIFEALAA